MSRHAARVSYPFAPARVRREVTTALCCAAVVGATSTLTHAQTADEPPHIELVPEEDPPEDSAARTLHRGSFARLSLGLGMARVWGKEIGPEPGFHPMEELSHASPTLQIAGQIGGGRRNSAVALELMHERLLTRTEAPSRLGLSWIALGVTVSHYFQRDWYATAHLRWVHAILWRPDVPCWWDRGDATSGPGAALTLGKEWFWRNEDGVGLGAQIGYASLQQGTPQLEYLSVLAMLTLTSF